MNHFKRIGLLDKFANVYLKVRDSRVEPGPVQLQPDRAADKWNARRGHRVQRGRQARRRHGHVHQARGRRWCKLEG